MGCWASTESEIRLILIYLMTHQVRIFIVAHLHSRLLTLFLIATWGIISTLLDQSYYFLGILRMSTKPRGFNQRVMLWRRMDYCFHIPPPTIHHRPFGYTNKWNKQDLTVCCVNVYWLWSSDEEHKLNTIRPLGLSLSLPPYFPRPTLVTIKVRTRNISLWGLRCAETGIFARQTLTANNNSGLLRGSGRSQCYNNSYKRLLWVEFKWL